MPARHGGVRPEREVMDPINDISSATVGGVQTVLPFTRPADRQTGGEAGDATSTLAIDRVELSPEATALAELHDAKSTAFAEDIRFELVARIRSEIENGTYDVDGKIGAIVDKLAKDLEL